MPDAVSFDVSGLSVYGDHITVRIGSASGLHEIAVRETGSGTPLGAYTVTPSVPATTAVVPLSPVPHSTSLTITITALGSTPGALDTITFYLPRDTTVPTNIASNVCTGGGYRYGYNGQMKDNEWAGEGNHLDFKFRGYDPRIGRFYSVNPLEKQHPWNSRYAFAENDVIRAMDLEGAEILIVTQVNAEKRTATIIIRKDIHIVKKNLSNAWRKLDTKEIKDLYTKGNTTLYMESLPENGKAVTYTKEESHLKGSSYSVNVIYDLNTDYIDEMPANPEFRTGQNTYVVTNGNVYYSEGAAARANTNLGTDVSLNPVNTWLFFNPDQLDGVQTREEAIVHEVGFHNMRHRLHNADSKGRTIYPTTPGLESNLRGNTYPNTEDTKEIINSNAKTYQRVVNE